MLETKLTIPKECPIIALSDIHADIDALIIALRDCAKVITKNPERYNRDKYGLERHSGFCHTNIRLDAGDAFLEYLLNLDLNIPENEEIFNEHCDLGYVWSGGLSHVVIVGDILDGLREESIFHKKCEHANQLEHQYPQIEVKILKFLNKLDECAEEENGRVIKLVGNHEAANFNRDLYTMRKYAFANTMDQSILTRRYYHGKSRGEYFGFGDEGFDLFRERGTAVLLIINDNIFVHGTLNRTLNYENICYINDALNERHGLSFRDRHFTQLFAIANNPETGILWDRTSGSDVLTSNRLRQQDKKHCTLLKQYIAQFCGLELCNKDNVKLIIGHCQQNVTGADMTQTQINTTIGNIVMNDGRVTTYRAESLDDIYTGVQNLERQITFGIAMECSRSTPERETTNHIVYKVDTGISRGFDSANEQQIIGDRRYREYREYVMHSILSFRTPQVLRIQNDVDYIIKSNSRNTRLHQPRVWLEELIHQHRIPGYMPAFGLPGILLEAVVVPTTTTATSNPILPTTTTATSNPRPSEAVVVPTTTTATSNPKAAEGASVQGGGQHRSYINYHKYMKYKKKYIEFKKTRKNTPK